MSVNYMDPATNNAVYSHPVSKCSLFGTGFPCSCRLCCCSQQDLLRKKEEKAEKELFMKEAAEAAQAQLYRHPIRPCSLLGIGFPCSCRLCQQSVVGAAEGRSVGGGEGVGVGARERLDHCETPLPSACTERSSRGWM